MTREQVQKEARHPNTECRDCHLGNGLSDDPAKAHHGMLKLIVLDNDLNIIPRKGHVERLLPAGNDQMREMLPRLAGGFLDDEVGTLMWHDRNTPTLGYDPAHCGKDLRQVGLPSRPGEAVRHEHHGRKFPPAVDADWDDIHGPNN